MATLNITTNMNRTQFFAALTAWDGATNVTGSEYVWACTDDINVSAEVDISAMSLSFAVSKNIKAITGGIITVSVPYIDTYIQPATLYLSNATRTKCEFVTGTGKWLGKGLTIHMSTGDISFTSSTSQTDLEDLTLEAEDSGNNYLFMDMTSGKINVIRVAGFGVSVVNGDFSMNPKGIGLVSGNGFAAAKFVANNKTLNNFVVQSSAAKQFNTSSTTFGVTTLNFKDGYVNPLFMGMYPKGNSSVIRKIQRTITFQPKSVGGTNISGFNYRISSNRVLEPASTTTPNTQIVTENNKAYGYSYVMTVWNGNTGQGSGTYGVALNQIIDKDLTVKVRKYKYKEGEFKSNSYYYAENATPTLEVDTYIKFSTPTLNHLSTAAELYDAVRSLVALDMELPEDLFATDGITIAIKPTWTLKRSATATNIAIDKTSKSITIDKDSYIAKYKALKWDYTGFTGTVDATMDGHTNMAFPRTDGKANLTIRVTCPFGVEDAVAGVWAFSQGVTNRANIIAAYKTGVGIIDIQLVVSPTEKYYAVAKGHGSNMTNPIIIDPVGSLGTRINISVDRIDKATGDGLIPVALTAAQQRISDMFIFDSTTNDIDIKLPTDYSTDTRWDGTNRIWQFLASDFETIAFKIDHIQTTTTFIATTQRAFFLDNKIELASDVHSGILKQSSQNTTIAGGAVKLSFNLFSISQFGDSFQKNTFIDNSNGKIDVVGGIPLAITVSAGLTPAEKAQLTAVKAESDKIPSIKTQTDKLTAIKAKTDLIVSGGGSGGLTPAQATQLTAVKTETDKIQSVKTETDKITAIKVDTNGIGGVKTVVDANKILVSHTKDVVNANKILATAIKTETDKIPAIQTKANETHQRLALDRAKPLTSKPDGGITSTGIAITATELADGSVVQTRGT